MVTEDSYQTISFVIRVELFLQRGTLKVTFVEESLKSERGVICTKNLCCEPFHFLGKMFIHRGGLANSVE